MKAVCTSATINLPPFSKAHKTHFHKPSKNHKFSVLTTLLSNINFSHTSSSSALSTIAVTRASSASTSTPSTSSSSSSTENRHWMVIMERPQHGANSEQEIVGYYAKTLERVIGREKDAQKCIYHTSCDTHFGFCCEIDEQAAKELACLPDVIVVKPDHDYNSTEKDYSYSNGHSNLEVESNLLFPMGSTKHWLVRMDRPGVGVVTKAQMVDFYAQILTKVLGNEQDAQMCIYHISWQSTFGFCCELDEQCARELAGMPGVLSVVPDENFGSENKNYGGNSTSQLNFSEKGLTVPINPRKLFVTGLSFYTSEKTLRSAFEGFGELVEVKVIMDKISKRSKGYAFIEYTSEEAASVALKEMNGKIINGWMIVVDYAKDSPRNSRTRHNRGRPR